MLLSRTVRASWSIAAVLLVATPGRIARADNTAANEGAFQHLRALQNIASASGGNGAAGTSGYDRSAEYVAERLKEAGYVVRLEEFEFPFFEERAPPVLVTRTSGGAQTPASADAVRTLVNSGSGDATGPLRSVNLRLDAESPMASTSGCETVDFQDFKPGSVALIRRGTCPFQTKVENAVAAGAIGVVIMNEGTDRRTDAFSGTLRQPAAIPVVGISYEHGHSLDIAGRADGATVRLAVNAVTEKRLVRISTACWRDLASTIMVAARPRCSKRRCDWRGSRPEHAVACVSPSGEQRSRASWARVNMSTVCPKMTVVTSCSTSISTWSARPTSCASFRALLRPIMPRLPLRDANSSLIFANIA